MAKRVHSVSLKGVFDINDLIIEEFDPKTETTKIYSLRDILEDFDGKSVSFSVKEEQPVKSIE
jgi:hypothetical protein